MSTENVASFLENQLKKSTYLVKVNLKYEWTISMKRGFRGSPLTRGTCITKCVSGKFPAGIWAGKIQSGIKYK